jgi:hypothetical protein
MTIDTLSKNEKNTLYGLVKLPTCNDRLLSEHTRLKVSTVTAIRNRLRREGYFRTVRIPFLERMGGELLVVSYTRLNPLRSREEQQRVLKDITGGADELFFAFADQFGMLSFSLCRNYTDAWSGAERIVQLLSDRAILSRDFSRQDVALFPFDQTRLLRFFDFSRLLGARFGLEMPEPPAQQNIRMEMATPRRLSRLEKKVFLGLTRYPAQSDNGVAKRIGVSRQSVSKLRKRFFSERLLVQVQIPDILKMDDGMVSVAWYEFAPGVSVSMRRKGMEWSLRELPSFFQVAGIHDGMIILLEKRFGDLQRHLCESARFHMEKGLLKHPPRMTNFAVRDILIVKEFSFAPAVKSILGMDEKKR